MVTSSLLFTIAMASVAGGPRPSSAAEQAPAADSFLIIPLRAHLLSSPNLPLADCKLRDQDVTRVVGKLNTIWHPAGIYFGLESTVHEPAVQTERFRLMAKLNGGMPSASDLQMLMPKETRVFDGVQAYFFHALPMNGAHLGDDIVVVQEGAQLNEVKGGIDEPMPRVLGFALGTALGLEPRREPQTSLLAPGTTGIELDEADVDRAQRVAKTVEGAMTRAEAQQALDAAQKAGKTDRAKLLRGWLAEIDAPNRAVRSKGRSRWCFDRGRLRKKTSPVLIAVCWLLVLVPLGWGVVQSMVKSMPLFHAPGAAAAKSRRTEG